MIHHLGILLLAALETAAPGDAAAFSRYQLILDKKPFGFTAEADSKATPAPTAGLPPLANGLKLVALEMDEKTGTVKAGIVDAAGKKSYYLTIGDEEDGLKLVDADFTGDRALVHKGEQEEWLAMGSGSSQQPAVPGSPSDPNREVARRQRFKELMMARPSNQPPAPTPVATNAPPWKNKEEMQEYFRKKNVDRLRTAGQKTPPLPMPPTPETPETEQ